MSKCRNIVKLPASWGRVRPRRAALVACAVALLIVAFPTRAYALSWDLGTSVGETIAKWIYGGAIENFNSYDAVIGAIMDNAPMSQEFGNLIGGNLYGLMSSIHQTAVIPVGESLLALFMLVQLVKISQRIDATATLPAVKDVVFLAVTFVIMHWVIVNSLGIVSSIYDIFNAIMPRIGSASSTVQLIRGTLDVDGLDPALLQVGKAVGIYLLSLLVHLTGLLTYIIVFVITYARAWQIYVLAAFSPIPLALLGFDETRQMGIGYLKNFASACLAGLVIMFLLKAFPIAITSVTESIGPGDLFEDSFNALLSVLLWVGTPILLCFSLIKSGAWAKEILGG